jgi:hypothetical protein
MWRTCYLIFLLLVLIGFSSCGDSNQTSENKKYLAKNIVLNNNSALANSTQKNSGGIFALNIVPNSYAQSDNIDTETKLLAENVIFENTSSSQIESDNVQDALEEITLKLADVMIGTWDIQNVIQAGCHETTGKIIINDDGTFNLTEGSFAAIGMGSGTATDPMCGHTEKNQTYEVYDDELIVFKHVNGIVNNMGTPRLVKLRENKIIFVGSGGCSCSEEEKISILTRTTN